MTNRRTGRMDESPAGRAGMDVPNLTAEPGDGPCPNVSMKRPEAGSIPACDVSRLVRVAENLAARRRI